MTPPTGSAPERSNSSSRWAQPVPRRTDENLKHVHRKIDRNLKSGAPLVDKAPLLDPESRRPRLPGAPSLLAGLGRLSASGPAAATAPAPAAAPPDDAENEDDFLARANAEQREELDSATVRDYLPVLVDKAVRRLLDPEETGSRADRRGHHRANGTPARWMRAKVPFARPVGRQTVLSAGAATASRALISSRNFPVAVAMMPRQRRKCA